MNYIVDTHALVWYLTKDKKLSKSVKDILQKSEKGKNKILIPVIVLLEAIDIAEKKKVNLRLDDLFSFIEDAQNFYVVDLNYLLAKEIIKIGRGLELHDRVIAAISEVYNATVLTKDSEIQKFTDTLW